MNIVIPMAGHSRRFTQAGYETPKPFIMIDGRPMIQRVCEMFDDQDHFIFVAQEKHLQKNKYYQILKNLMPNSKIIAIKEHEKGPVFSTLYAEESIDQTQGLIISYCDFYQEWDYRQYLRDIHSYDGGIATFRGFHAASFGDTFYAYLKANSQMEMLELREKASFTDQRRDEHASSGVYSFANWGIFKKYADELLNSEMKLGSEYYVSLIYNLMVRDQCKVKLHEISKFICWGTPEDLEQYLFWSQYFAKDLSALKDKISHD
ncbi:NTP transferase domain-containing protein [bacterium]|nr:NTP transferase domain-containing protein [bacterium]